MKKSLLLLGGALVLFSNSAFGWGKMGHDAIAYIAECNLTPKAKKTIDKQQDDSTVVMSLRCIIHFVGDMHCPVHVKYADQKSYNVYLNGDKCSYHNVWDDQIISRSHRWGYLEYAHQLDRCTKQQIKTITAGTLRDWFHENARDSRHIYELVGPNEKLDKNETKSFVNHTHEYAERQILRAGYRLAHVLNELFD